MSEDHRDAPAEAAGATPARKDSPEYIAELFEKNGLTSAPASWGGQSREEVLAELNRPRAARAGRPRGVSQEPFSPQTKRRFLLGAIGVVVVLVVAGIIAGSSGSDGGGGGQATAGTKQSKAGTATCYEVSKAVTKFNSAIDGRRDSTMTPDDVAKALQSITSKLDEGASFGGPTDFLALVTHASTTIKQMRVALLSGEDDLSIYQSSAVDDLTRAAPFCN
jgi:hypothetical protein